MGDIVLGIDLGTTNSVVAVADGAQARVLADADGKRLIPSVVSFPEGSAVVVGEIARERRLVDAQNTVYAIKRLIGRPFDAPEVERAKERFAFALVEGPNRGVRVEVRGERYSLAEISAYVLRECRRVAEEVLGETVEKAVVTVPANFNELQRSATKAAGTVAGLEILRIINEPTAAALAYGAGAKDAERIAVYDFGGGTFDITILDLDDDVFEVVATAGDTFLGGDDIDVAVAEAMSDAFAQAHGFDPRSDLQAFERLRAAGEWVKCTLSSEERVTCRVAELATAADGSPLDLELTMTREELEELVLPLANQSLRVCAEALRLGDVDASSIDGVVLVGGSTRIPMVRRMVRNFFSQEPRTDIDPDLVVALGAAVQAYSLSSRTPRTTLSVVPGPSPARAREVREQKEAARAERPAQPAFAPDEADAPSPSPGPSTAPPGPRRSPTLPKLPEPSQAPPATNRTIQGYRPPAPPGAPAKPGAAATQPDAAPSIELDEDYQADLELLGTGVFETETTDELDFDLDLELQEGSAAEPLPAPPPPPPPAAKPPATPPASGAAPKRDELGTPFDDMVASTPFDDMVASTPLELEEPAPPLPPSERGGADVQNLPPPVPVAAPPADEAISAPPPPQPVVQMGDRPPPVLMDVTPHTLGIETVGGFCERIIRRNAPIPIEQTRIFTTAQDDQDTVRVTVCQGELRTFADNQPLGELELTGLRPARRGEVRIEVTFMLDASGTLAVKATDMDTGKVQSIQINLLGGYDDDEMESMRARQEASLAS